MSTAIASSEIAKLAPKVFAHAFDSSRLLIASKRKVAKCFVVGYRWTRKCRVCFGVAFLCNVHSIFVFIRSVDALIIVGFVAFVNATRSSQSWAHFKSTSCGRWIVLCSPHQSVDAALGRRCAYLTPRSFRKMEQRKSCVVRLQSLRPPPQCHGWDLCDVHTVEPDWLPTSS